MLGFVWEIKPPPPPSLAEPSKKDSLALVLHQQPAGRLHEPPVRELRQPRPVSRGQHAPPRAVGRLLHPLEPPHEAPGTPLPSAPPLISLAARTRTAILECKTLGAPEVTGKLKPPLLKSENKSLVTCKRVKEQRLQLAAAGPRLEAAAL